MFKGVWGKLLRVNLSKKEILKEDIPVDLFKNFIGGSGLATKYLYDEVAPSINALSPHNKIIFATGPFQGIQVPGGGKWSIVSRSPLTGTFAVTSCGASWGVNFKKTGYDMMIIEGETDEPVYIWVNDDEVKIKDANNLWGKDAYETVSLIREELQEEKASVATIGPAGEKKVRIACITVDKHSFAGRCGLGAVLGSKKVKAIAVKGNKKIPVAEIEEINKLNRKIFRAISANVKETFKAHGTPIEVMSAHELGDLPIKNWNDDVWPEGAEKIGAPNYTEELNAKSLSCMYCPIGCHRNIETKYNGEKIKGAGAQYETLAMLGSNCLVDNLQVITKANDLCNRLGIDTISAGSYIAFTMECFEKGLISEKDLNGHQANWGNGEFLIEMIKQIANRTGFGAKFARGIKPAAAQIGKKAEELIVEVKNLDFPAHDPRTYFSLAINYATGTRGACHLRGYPHVGEAGMKLPEVGFEETPERFNMEGQAKLVALFQDLAALHDSLVICIFIPISGLSFKDTTNYLNYITGYNFTHEMLLIIGERIINLQRQINVKDGISIKNDKLPPKMFVQGKKGFRKGRAPKPFQETLLKFYGLRRWDKNGRPTQDKLKELGLA